MYISLFREIRLMESLENLCDHMKSYVSRARRKFPYVKGGKLPLQILHLFIIYGHWLR